LPIDVVGGKRFDGYAIALASLMLAGGTIGDLRGHRCVVLTGLALFGLASLAAGVAPSTDVLALAAIPAVRLIR
jgi:DHA2 family methylenomycin A resistance protein-like MFS transporter